ncbi:hypothetical protein TNCV_4216211 [Trichonephila clavipes]|nr:hypothetical protein TNCV_4216211 [Trichonephila clavipes]
MPTPVPWSAALDYTSEGPWRGQLDRNDPPDSRLGLSQVSMLVREEWYFLLWFFESHTYKGSCMTLRIILQVDAITLRKNNAHIGVLVLVHRGLHYDE